MTDNELFEERARIYAGSEEVVATAESRCLEVKLGERVWLFPEESIRLLLPEGRVTALPGGVRWGVWPCAGLVIHAMTSLPLLCWGRLAGQRELTPDQQPEVLVLRASPVALRVPGPVLMTSAALDELKPDDHPWSAGRLASGASLVDLGRLTVEGGA